MVISSTVSPRLPRARAAPVDPESFETAMAMRGVCGCGPERRLAQTRVSQNHDAVRVDLLHRLQTVYGAAYAPRPRPDGLHPHRVGYLAVAVEHRQHALGISVSAVGEEVVLAYRRYGISASHGLGIGPAAGIVAARGNRRRALRLGGHDDGRVGRGAVVALEVEPEDYGYGGVGSVGYVQEHVGRMLLARVCAERYAYLTACGRAVESLTVLLYGTV